MAGTDSDNLSLPTWTMAQQMVDLITATYRASGAERGRYHDRSFESDGKDNLASQSLFLVETPIDALAGIVSWRGRLTPERHAEFVRLVTESPLATSMAIQQRLRAEGANQLALVIERADHLRLLLWQLLQANAPERRVETRHAL